MKRTKVYPSKQSFFLQESSSKRKKTPPGATSETERKKQLIRALGRKPSEERVSVYVRKSSVTGDHSASVSPKNSPTEPENKTKQFMDSMAARNRQVGCPTIKLHRKPCVT